MKNTWQLNLKKRLTDEYVENLENHWVDLDISPSGNLNLTIVSDQFIHQSLPERKAKILNIIQKSITEELKISITPGFLSLYTVEEAKILQLVSPQTQSTETPQTWQDLAIWAANPQNQELIKKNKPRIPRTVTFYSFKGGVGRTTALAHVSWILAQRGRKVVVVDLDLEAPGLSTTFKLNPQPESGIIDYFYERVYLPAGLEPSILITQIFGEVKIANSKGRLFVVPAGFLSLDYIAKLDDLRASSIINHTENIWTTFCQEINDHLKPDILLVDSRTGINQWGALSLLQAADDVIIFLFPNEQNRQGIELLIESIQDLKNINFVFTPVPDVTESGLEKVKPIWQDLYKRLNKEEERDAENEDELDDSPLEIPEPLVIAYLPPIALADQYPVPALLDYYTRIANLIDEETDELHRESILTSLKGRWSIIKDLHFPEVDAADPKQNLDLLFQKTTDFDKFLDDTTCLIRGRKGTGKTALYWLLLQHSNVAKELAHGRLNNTIFFSGHGGFDSSRPTREAFTIIHKKLKVEQARWESFWSAYLVLKIVKNQNNDHFKFNIPKGKGHQIYAKVRRILESLPSINSWNSKHTNALIDIACNHSLIIKDLMSLIDNQAKDQSKIVWFLYDDLDEDFPSGEIRQEALVGLFQFLQACDAQGIKAIRFKIFLREDIWNQLNFDNKSHLNGRDILLQWTRLDFLRLSLRQAMQSQKFKEIVDRFSPIESIDQASEESIDQALQLLWGTRRRRGDKAKYVSRWVYERLTDASGTTFPRSLSVLLKAAKDQELTYENQSSIQASTDRLLRAKSLEVGLKKASEERCNAIKQEYPDFENFLTALKGHEALLPPEELEKIWQQTAQQQISSFAEFTQFLSQIGLAEFREKDKCYRFADIYVHGFEMNRRGTL